MERTPEYWRRCSSCKKPIPFNVAYWVCSVSTCTRKRTGFAFCAVSCWDAHVPTMRHRNAWAEERTSPARDQWQRESVAPETQQARSEEAAGTRRRIVRPVSLSDSSSSVPTAVERPADDDVLVVASRLKAYVRDRSGMNTSASVLTELSDRIRDMCDNAIGAARREGRKTVLDRDFR